MRTTHRILFLVTAAVIASIAVVAAAQDTVEEKSTGTQFPKTITFAEENQTYEIEVTGLAVRKKYWVKVYAVAHYMGGGETYDSDAAALTVALSDQYPKQITLAFVRDVGADKIHDAFEEDIKKNASEAELAEITAVADKFVSFFKEDAKKGERMVFRVVPGGRLTTIIHGEEREPIDSVTFSRVLWRIWLGEHSVVDRDHLVEMAVVQN
jgi:hypothetical protein